MKMSVKGVFPWPMPRLGWNEATPRGIQHGFHGHVRCPYHMRLLIRSSNNVLILCIKKVEEPLNQSLRGPGVTSQTLETLGDRIKCAPKVSEGEMNGHRFSRWFKTCCIAVWVSCCMRKPCWLVVCKRRGHARYVGSTWWPCLFRMISKRKMSQILLRSCVPEFFGNRVINLSCHH